MSSEDRAVRIATDVKYRGRIFSVREDRVTLPGGRTVQMDLVEHRGSVVLLPMISPRELVMVRQYRYAIDRWIWELPAGSVEAGEDPDEAARRECREEVRLEPGSIARLGAFYPTPGFCTEVMVFYRIEGLTPLTTHVELDEDEDLEPRTVTLDEARRLVATGDIADMKTIVGLSMMLGVWDR